MHEGTRNHWLHRLQLLLSGDPANADECARNFIDGLAGGLQRPWILHGAGTLGARVYEHMLACGYRVVAVTDSETTRQGTLLGNHSVESPTSALARWKNEAAVLVTIFNPYHSFLETAGCLRSLTSAPIIPVQAYFWRFPKLFLPYFAFDRPSVFLQSADLIRESAESLSDMVSLECYYKQLAFRISLDIEDLPLPDMENQYFPPDIIGSNIPGPFVDCGAFDGDTLKSLLRRTGSSVPEIIAYEPDVENFRKLTGWVKSIPHPTRPKISCRPSAVGNRTCQVSFNAFGGSSSRVSANGSHLVNMVRLDEDLAMSSPGWIKMDLEGHELEALQGAENLYSISSPVFSICLYHRPSDLWTIPLYLKSHFPNDMFFLRSHGPDGFELVFYALPPCPEREAI